MLIWKKIHPLARPDMLGYIPGFISTSDQRSAAEQLNESYAHGGGWTPFGQDKWTLNQDKELVYPEDDPLPCLFETQLRDETLRFYPYALLAIIQPDGSFEVARLD